MERSVASTSQERGDGARPRWMRARRLLRRMANALPVMFNAKDTQSRYLFMNRYQAELYGVATDDAVGRTAADLLGPEYGAYTGRSTPR